jgi:hypothetical protein
VIRSGTRHSGRQALDAVAVARGDHQPKRADVIDSAGVPTVRTCIRLLLLFLLSSPMAGCSGAATSDHGRTKPTPLVNVGEFAADYQEAARSRGRSYGIPGQRANIISTVYP